MTAKHNRSRERERDPGDLRDAIRQAFREFLKVPTWIIVSFLLLAVGVNLLDRATVPGLQWVRYFMQAHVFANAQATGDLLGTIAGSLITVTSITFSLLLLAVQQSAASMSGQVIDQFLRRRINQVSFGFFIGLALFALLTLATVDAPFNPVYGATLTLLLTVVALGLLLVLLYTSIHQMRSSVIVEAIHDLTLAARQRQLAFLCRTRSSSLQDGAIRFSIRATRRGFVTMPDLDALGAAAANAQGDVEVLLRVSIGAYVAFQDVIAEVRAERHEDAVLVGKVVGDALHLARQRDLDVDSAYGIDQLVTIAWTSISSAKSNPDPGLLTIRTLRDLLAHWSVEEEEIDLAEPPVPVVYTDNVFAQLMDAFETLAVVASESMQHHVLAEILHTFSVMFDRLPAVQQARAEDLILRVLSALGDHVLTAGLDAVLSELAETLLAAGREATAHAVQTAHNQLRLTVGKLGSRSTRAAAD